MGIRIVAASVAGLMTATLLASAPLVAAADAPPGESARAVQAGAVDWGRCADPDLKKAKAQCGMLEVPLDHAVPDGPTIQIAVSRVLHTRSPYRGVVFTNPGGPGGSGRSLATYGSYVPGNVAETYDWYGIDPRGVGESKPALACDGGYLGWDRPDYVPSTAKLMKFWRRTTETYAQDCADAPAKRLLAHLRTTDTAADFDTLRDAVGADQITLYGFSYGTYLAQVYATLYPDRVKALIMDGVVDPDRVFYQSNIDQDRAFQKSFEKFFAWIGRHPRVYHLGRGKKAVVRTYEKLRAKLARHPAGGKIGPDELDDALLPGAYYSSYYAYVAGAFSALATKGEGSGIKNLYGGPGGKGADNGYATYLGTECTDANWPQDWSSWQDDMWRVHKKAPFLTWANAWFNAPCRAWPVAGQTPVDVTGAGLTAPVLLLNETHDPATPYAGALAVRRLFPSAALVAGVGGYSHAVSLSGISCTDNTIAHLLKDGSLPTRRSGNRADKECKPVPPPDPVGWARKVPTRPLLPFRNWGF
jgi:pimeloyl-ACP methyl ester carboxylesterase